MPRKFSFPGFKFFGIFLVVFNSRENFRKSTGNPGIQLPGIRRIFDFPHPGKLIFLKNGKSKIRKAWFKNIRGWKFSASREFLEREIPGRTSSQKLGNLFFKVKRDFALGSHPRKLSVEIPRIQIFRNFSRRFLITGKIFIIHRILKIFTRILENL